MATMSAEDRAKAEMDKRQRFLKMKDSGMYPKGAEFEAAKELAAQNLPVNFARMVADADKRTLWRKISSDLKQNI